MLSIISVFTFVLKGRFAERGTHALLVFALWIYATRFYQYILAYYKKKEIFAGSVIGMIFSIILAVLQAIAYAKEYGYEKMYLDSLSTSKKAIALYRKTGFVDTERYNKNKHSDVFMVLYLK